VVGADADRAPQLLALEHQRGEALLDGVALALELGRVVVVDHLRQGGDQG
jgi:hypothetical protein